VTAPIDEAQGASEAHTWSVTVARMRTALSWSRANHAALAVDEKTGIDAVGCRIRTVGRDGVGLVRQAPPLGVRAAVIGWQVGIEPFESRAVPASERRPSRCLLLPTKAPLPCISLSPLSSLLPNTTTLVLHSPPAFNTHSLSLTRLDSIQPQPFNTHFNTKLQHQDAFHHRRRRPRWCCCRRRQCHRI